MFKNLCFISCVLLAGVFSCSALAGLPGEWPEVVPDTKASTGFQRSLNLQPPANDLLLPAQVLAMAEKIPATTDTWTSVVLFSYDSTAFDANGYYYLIQQEAVKILDQRAIQENQVVRLNYDIPYDRTRVLQAYVINPDGSVVYLDSSSIKDVSNSDDMDVNIYEPIWRSLVINFPGVQVGSIIYYAYENVAVNPRTPDSFQWGHTFRGSRPIASARIQLKGPKDLPIYWVVSNNDDNLVTFSQKSRDDSIIYRWESGFASMIRKEPSMIPISELMTSLQFSTDTWESFSAREAPLIEENLEPDHAIRAKVIELTEHLNSDEAKMRALFNYVTQKVRYMGVAFGDRPGVNPDPVTRTFANNAGVCKDKAGLLTAMLRIAGIEACYTLNNPECRIEQRVAVDQFNHAIVAARIPGESDWRFLDVTSDLSRSMCPASSGGTQVLRIVSKSGTIESIPISTPQENTGTITAETAIDATGKLTSTVTMTGHGQSDQYTRETLYYTEPQKIDGLFEWLVESVSLEAHISNWVIKPENLDDLTMPIDVSFSYTADNYGIQAERYFLVKVPQAQLPFNWFFMDLQDACGIDVRHQVLDLASTSRTVTRETVILPEGYHLKAIPDDIHVDGPILTFLRKWVVEGRVMTLEQELIIKEPRVPPSEYTSLRTMVKKIQKSGESFLILEEN